MRINYIPFIVINFLLMGLPLVAVFFIKQRVDIYEFRTLLTEKGYLFILAMASIVLISFFKIRSRPLSLLTRMILVLETAIGIYLYLRLYDYLLTY